MFFIPSQVEQQTDRSLLAAWKSWTAWSALVLGCTVLYLSGADRFDLLTDDEIRYAEAGRIMAQSGHWVIPEYNGYPRYQKPILFYWLQAISQKVLGSTPLAARLPSALAGVAVVLVTALLAARVFDARTGLLAGVVLALSVEVFLLSRMVMTDMVLLLWTQGAVACSIVAGLPETERRLAWHRLAFLLVGLGCLTKGPISGILWGLTIFPWWLSRMWRDTTVTQSNEAQGQELRQPGAQRGERMTCRYLCRLVLEGAVLVLFVAGPWYALAHYVTDGAFTRTFFIEENLARFTSTVNRHPQTPLFYLLLVVPMTFPWTWFVPGAILQAGGGPFDCARDRIYARLLLWQVIVPFALFTASETKVWTYTLPAFPPLSILVARWLGRRSLDPGVQHVWRAPALVLLAGSILALGVALVCRVHWLPQEIRVIQFLSAVRTTIAVLCVLSMGICLAAYWRHPRWASAVFVAGISCWYMFFVHYLVPVFDRIWNEPVREVAAWLRHMPHMRVLTYEVHELGVNFMAGKRHVEHWRERSSSRVADLLQEDEPLLVLTRPVQVPRLSRSGFYVWGGNQRLVYGSNRPRPAGGPASVSPSTGTEAKLQVSKF